VDTSKRNLLGMTRPQLEQFFEQMGEKRFRAQQIMKWMYHQGVDNFDEMTNVGNALRSRLSEIAEIRVPKVTEESHSEDGTHKWVVQLDGGSHVETVLIPEGKRATLCVSSQIGCALDCSFCSTGKQGFNRDLTSAEIIGQVWIANKSLANLAGSSSEQARSVSNVVMMGMGEPLLNFQPVVDAMNLMMDDIAYGISKRRVTLSTSGVVPEIDRLAAITDVSLAISLHAPTDELRNQLVPINKKYPIKELLAACKRYLAGLGEKRVITIEYIMIDAVNDSLDQANQLADILIDLPCKINLIPFNPFPNSGYQRSSGNAVRRFQTVLREKGYVTTVRSTRGEDIDAACGQLVGQVEDRTKRSSRYIKLASIN